MPQNSKLNATTLAIALKKESANFQKYYAWLETHMPPTFFEQIDTESLIAIVHSLTRFDQGDFFSPIHLKQSAFVLSLDSPDADLKILKQYGKWSITNYRSFVSNSPPPFPKITAPLRITSLFLSEDPDSAPAIFSKEQIEKIANQVCAKNENVAKEDVKSLFKTISPLFLNSMTEERLTIALDLFFRAKTRDNCQFGIKQNWDWEKKKETPSLQVVIAWRNVPRYNFLYRLAHMVYRHGLVIKRINATHIDPYKQQNILLLSLGLHGMKGKAAWEEADVDDFLKELVTLKYFEEREQVETVFVDTHLVSGNFGNLLKTMIYFVHQALVPIDPNLYTLENIEEGFCRHPELTIKLTTAFEAKFHPKNPSLELYHKIKQEFFASVQKLDTGSSHHDMRRKQVLTQAFHMIEYSLKTNFYRQNKTALSFRLDPTYLDHLPFERKEKFPELPFGIFFMKGFYFTGFHIRFRDLSRGGLRTVFPERQEQVAVERNNLFSECYHLAYTQNKKNKDIPEGGAKGVIFLEPYAHLQLEEETYKRELEELGVEPQEVQEKLAVLKRCQRIEYLYAAQRSYIESFLTLINCTEDGVLKAKEITDYWKKPEYIYLGPDENMHNLMIEWIAAFSKYYGYKPGGAFISSKPSVGINHKEFGVTSLGVNVYAEELLHFMGIDPSKNAFTIKMSGGPDGDVAGNEMANLYKFYPHNAKLLASVDVSGTIFDPKGLDLKEIHRLFEAGQPLCFYPPSKLNDGGFLLDTKKKKEESAYTFKTLCYRKQKGKVQEEWLSGDEMNALLRHNVHSVQADLFIPGGGRPRTLNETNWEDFLDPTGKPTARGIVEGANLYLTTFARHSLEQLGTLIIKDSSANKGGVICSSFEVLCSLVLTEEEFIKEKPTLVKEILSIIEDKARLEAKLLLNTHQKTKEPLTLLSEKISEKINLYKDELLNHLQTLSLSNNPQDPLIQCLLNYAPPILRTKYKQALLLQVPDIHKKAIIACHIASRLVYFRGLNWAPSLIDVLPLITQDREIVGSRVD